jgi:nucleoside-diphosphate-sugar epimerase
MKILVTGAAGFIGMSTALRLLARGDEVVGLDNLNDYYDVSLKEDRLRRQHPHAVLRARQCRSPGESLCGDQEGQRADGAHL